MTEYHLSLTRTKAGLLGLWNFDGASGEALEIAPTLTEEDLAEHRWYLERYLDFPGPGDHARAAAFERRLEKFGEELYVALRHDGVDVLRDLVEAPEPRVLTLTSADPRTLSLPWELLRDKRSALVFRDVVLRRALPARAAVKAVSIPSLPLRILLVIARPTDAGEIDARSSAAPMLDALEKLGDQVRVEICDPPTLAEVERRLGDARDRGERHHVVHFDGHGVYVPDPGYGALCFEKPDATTHQVRGGDFGDLLARMDVPLVFLEACQTADLARAPVFDSVAPALLKAGVGSVVAFSHSVVVTAARILVARFYETLCKGHRVGAALNEGRRALQADPVRLVTRRGDVALRDWHIAQLYQSGPDPVLVPAGAAKGAAGTAPLQRGKAPSPELAVEPMYGFHGRAGELLTLQRKLRKHGAVVVQGGGGMGKTSLAREAARWWHRIGLRPDGAAFFSFEGRSGVDRAVQSFVAYVEGEAYQQGSPEELRARAVRYFREREVLWVWDNFESTLPRFQKGDDEGAAVFPDDERDRLRRLHGELTKRGAKGWLLVTCRPDDTGLGKIAEMPLGGLSRSDALEMTREILALRDVKLGEPGYEREDVEDLLEAVDFHPLSIELVMAHCKAVTAADAASDLREIVAAAIQEAGEERNTSLAASLRWSTARLSAEARALLPYLAWFEGGAFEAVITVFCGVSPEAWRSVREELLATALARVVEEVRFAGTPHLGFHPTLPYAADPGSVKDVAEVGKRFVAAYRALARWVRDALWGADPRDAMVVAQREERNLRRAAALAFEQGDHQAGASLAETIDWYLNRAGRVRDQMRLADWVQRRMAESTGAARWAAERGQAWGLFLAGQREDAIALLTRQRGEIEGAGGDVGQRSRCAGVLGRILVHAGQPQLALGLLEETIEGCEAVDDRENLVAALGDKANALMLLGTLDDALTCAERALSLERERGHARGEAVGLGQTAEIFAHQRRFSEAEERYGEALEAARRIGDGGLEGLFLQHLGMLAGEQEQPELARTRYKEALARFQATEDQAQEMRTADLLGTAERELEHHEAAQAWYAEAERLARALGDEMQLAGTIHNVGVLRQVQATALPEAALDERRLLLREGVASVTASLALRQKRGDEAGVAASFFQLGALHQHLGELDEAERHMTRALAFYEPRDLPELYKVYANLESIAAAGDRPEGAATWRARKNEKYARLAAVQPEMRKSLLGLCQLVHGARATGEPLHPDTARAVAQLAELPDPLGGAGRFLQRVAAGEVPDPPEGLPPPLAEILEALLYELRATPIVHALCPCDSGKPFAECHGA